MIRPLTTAHTQIATNASYDRLLRAGSAITRRARLIPKSAQFCPGRGADQGSNLQSVMVRYWPKAVSPLALMSVNLPFFLDPFEPSVVDSSGVARSALQSISRSTQKPFLGSPRPRPPDPCGS